MDFLVLFSVFLRQKINIDGNVSITNHESEIWLLNFSGLAINQKTDNNVTICQYSIIAEIFWHWRVSLVKFSYCSRFHVDIIIGSGVMTIFAYKGLTRNLKIGSTPVWILPNVWRQGQLYFHLKYFFLLKKFEKKYFRIIFWSNWF